jgi:hypothetical protein
MYSSGIYIFSLHMGFSVFYILFTLILQFYEFKSTIGKLVTLHASTDLDINLFCIPLNVHHIKKNSNRECRP